MHPNDLFDLDTTPVEQPARSAAPVAAQPRAASARGPFDAAAVIIAGGAGG